MSFAECRLTLKIMTNYGIYLLSPLTPLVVLPLSQKASYLLTSFEPTEKDEHTNWTLGPEIPLDEYENEPVRGLLA